MQALRYSSEAQTRLGLRFVPFPGLSSSGDGVFRERGRCNLSPPPSLPLGFLGVQLVHLLRWMLTVQNPKKSSSAKKPACSLVDNCPLPALAACHHRGVVCSHLALYSPLFCVWVWWCLGAFRVVAIPQSGLLAQVSSLRLPSGHSGQILTLSNAAHTSLPSPPLASGR